MGKISVLLLDVDGTLTDGQIHISSQRELFKSFDAKDGYGISVILPQHHITPVIITGRESDIVKHRADELRITHLYQGIKDKSACVKKIISILSVSPNQIACIGDDLNDLPMMQFCGIKGCPADAAGEVQEVCDYVCKSSGGRGAIREFIEWMIAEGGY